MYRIQDRILDKTENYSQIYGNGLVTFHKFRQQMAIENI